ncbi:MAG: 8-oxo-dGTP diphosphatase MutT [Deltaproteobacteria bacterium]|nr:MAG: 8-oxo-dGTP diphosphatase MutT [Deltaproteobacteria bacterium]
MQKNIEVVAAIIQGEGDRTGQYLISQRLKESALGHCWEFPGGKVEPGETLEQCAVRECQEEIDVVVEPIRLVKDVTFEYPHGKFLLHFMLCRLVSGDPKPIFCREVKWVRAEDLGQYQFPEADLEVIAHLQRS